MELIVLFLGIWLLFWSIGGCIWLMELMKQPKAVKRIGKRRLYVKWNEERQD